MVAQLRNDFHAYNNLEATYNQKMKLLEAVASGQMNPDDLSEQDLAPPSMNILELGLQRWRSLMLTYNALGEQVANAANMLQQVHYGHKKASELKVTDGGAMFVPPPPVIPTAPAKEDSTEKVAKELAKAGAK